MSSVFVLVFHDGQSDGLVALYRTKAAANKHAELENKFYTDRHYSKKYRVEEWTFADDE